MDTESCSHSWSRSTFPFASLRTRNQDKQQLKFLLKWLVLQTKTSIYSLLQKMVIDIDLFLRSLQSCYDNIVSGSLPPTRWNISWRCLCTACCTQQCPSLPHLQALWSPMSYRSRTPANHSEHEKTQFKEIHEPDFENHQSEKDNRLLPQAGRGSPSQIAAPHGNRSDGRSEWQRPWWCRRGCAHSEVNPSQMVDRHRRCTFIKKANRYFSKEFSHI